MLDSGKQSQVAKGFSEEKIRLLFVSNTLGLGGAEMQLARVVSHFDPRIDVEIAFYKNSKGLPYTILNEAGFTIHLLDRDKWGRLLYFHKATKFMKSRSYDMVHAWNGTANLYGRVPAILADVPVIISGTRDRKIANWLLVSIYSLTNFRCSAWVVNARNIKRSAKKKLKFMKNRPIYAIPNGISINDPSILMRNKKTEYDRLRGNRLVVGTVGRMAPVKNHKMFIEMARLVLEKGVEADFWLIGDGPLRHETGELVKRYGLENNIKLLGPRTDVDVALARMDVFCLTSNSEGCPNVLLEASRAGLPIVSTNCGSLEDIIEVDGNGFLADVGDKDAMAEKVISLLKNEHMRNCMGQRGREIIDERFRIEISAKKLERVYLSCLFRAGQKRPYLREKLTRLGLEDPGPCEDLL